EQRLVLAKELVKYALSDRAVAVEKSQDETEPADHQFAHPFAYPSTWMHWLFTPWWKFAAVAAVVVCVGLWTIQNFSLRSPAETAIAALNEAYRDGRPVEARITGFGYAQFRSPNQRGISVERNDRANEVKFDAPALERAKKALFVKNLN